MASSSLISSLLFALSIILVLLSSHFHAIDAQSSPPLVTGLSYTFYNSTCPDLESIVRTHLTEVFNNDIGQAAALLRIHFHDCFVLGCEGSVLLDRTANQTSEKDAIPNLTLRAEAFTIIEDLRRLVHNKCGRVVSCADITALAARDSVVLSGGPEYNVPFGRRDGTSSASNQTVLANLPAPFNVTNVTLAFFANKNLDLTDTVALSGAHTIGRSHCTSFTNRLYPTQDNSMDQTFASRLRLVCPAANTTNTTIQDIRTPNVFDNKYYVNLMNRQTLFTSDQSLYSDNRTRGVVTSFAVNQTLFFEKFVFAMIKMGQISVLTGTQGEIRANCSSRNSNNNFLSSVVEEVVENSSGF